MSSNKYTEEWIKVSDLIVDPKVQRIELDDKKVHKIEANYNPDALGTLTVSRRKDSSQVILDGWHRQQATKMKLGDDAQLYCRVFEGLTFKEECQMFLDLNYTNQPKVFDAWGVRYRMEEPVATRVTDTLRSFSWEISHQSGAGKFNAILAAERLDRLSQDGKLEPGLVHITALVVTRAWGHDRYAVVGVIFEGLGRFLAEYGNNPHFDIQVLINKLKAYEGGPRGLLLAARQMASLRRMKAPMAVADLLVEEYNRGLKRNALPAWRARR